MNCPLTLRGYFNADLTPACNPVFLDTHADCLPRDWSELPALLPGEGPLPLSPAQDQSGVGASLPLLGAWTGATAPEGLGGASRSPISCSYQLCAAHLCVLGKTLGGGGRGRGSQGPLGPVLDLQTLRSQPRAPAPFFPLTRKV